MIGRRISTTMTDVRASAALPHVLTTASTFDPEVEFLEIATTINGKRTWKIYGPDLDGRFGGLQGIGGLEATIQETGNISTGLLTDAFGNGVGTISGNSLTWHKNRSGSYGILPGHTALSPNESVTVAQATAWRGKSADATGFYNLGARYYEPSGGRFLSADPMGHSASISLYDYANGDPVNFADPDGRVGKAIGGALGIRPPIGSSSYSVTSPSFSVVNNSFSGSRGLTSNQVLSMTLNSIPAVGLVKSYIELSSGNDLITGAQISHSQSALNVLANAVPFAAGSISKFGAQGLRTSIGAVGISGGGRGFAGTAPLPWSVAKTAGRTNAQLVQEVATRADAWGARQGLGFGPRSGTLKHGYADELLTRYQNIYGQRGLQTETSWLGNAPATYGTRGSARLDVWEPATGTVFDYKFGNAVLSPAQVNKITTQGPLGVRQVIKVKP
jgi:RHS repeat-associated protein